MKILTLIQCANLGGMEQSTLLLLDGLKAMGHEVELLSLNELGPLKPVLEKKGIPSSAVGYRGRWGWRSFFSLRRSLRRKKADSLIMVGHNLMAMLALGDFCKKKRILSLHFHHQGVKSQLEWRLIYSVAIWKFKSIIYPSRFIMDEAITIVPELKTTQKTVSYPIPTPISIPNEVGREGRLHACSLLGLPPHFRYVGNAGWLIPRKRWDIFLSVAEQVVREIPDVRFLIAGDGPEREKLELLSRELGIEDHVIWLGWQSGLETFYRVIDVMVFNSDWDAMGRTPLEAMSYGIPVVASMLHGGLSEMLSSRDHGFLIDIHDVSQLSAQVIRLLQDPRLARSIGKAARMHIEEVGSPKRHAERILDLLEVHLVSTNP
jgi:glycosyltransferase involved in cell wall biosynthesis